ncbi:MAG: polyphosphate kinase 1 [Nitrososphaerota archaeon]|jgi:polyphosphate kinase|nr:polyphosphate kinase 1 [Nitrososphaerota archaeon]
MTNITSTIEQDKVNIDRCMQNRELSWLKFNERVLEEASFTANPPLERLKFISIFSSNLDEFYMIRVGSLTDCMLFVPEYFDNKTGMTAEQQLDAIFKQTTSLYALRDHYFFAVLEDLSKSGINHLKMSDLNQSECKKVEKQFVRDIMPLLSPQIIDNRHPFPHLDNKQLHIAVTLEHKRNSLFGLIAVPRTLERIIFLETSSFVLLEDVIYYFSHIAFKPYKVQNKTILSVTRNADIKTDEGVLDEDIDYRQFMQKLLKKRQRLTPVRLELQYAVKKTFIEFFCEKLKLKDAQVFLSSTPLDLTYHCKLEEKIEIENRRKLVKPVHIPCDIYPTDKKISLIKHVQKTDLLLSHPYESILPFLEMIKQAAEDPTVLSIKITLYRLDSQSKLAESLIRAAENGKEVIVLMELRARFDEANNIEWSKRLDEAGCRVIYGPTSYKVHSKICLITKKENGKIQYITQIGTGNYNEKTAKQYTDLSLITANQEIGKDTAIFFNNLLLGNLEGKYTYLWVAPNYYKQNILQCIENEQKKAENGESGRIIIKCNSLTDKEVIIKLIEAAQSGVKISMIVRGICCLIPGVPQLTENITIISIIGEFLEHSRIYCFGTGNNKKIYISSADLMTRNTERRIEITCPVLDEDIKQRIFEMLETMLLDNTKAREHFSDGRYVLRHSPIDQTINSQKIFTDQARTNAARTLAEHMQNIKETNIPSNFTNIGRRAKDIFMKFRNSS